MSKSWPKVRLGELLRRSEEMTVIVPDVEYREITVRLWGKGVVERGRVTGAEISGSRRSVARTGQFIVSRIDARNGAMGIVPAALDGAVVTNDFPLFAADETRLSPAYLGWLCRTSGFVELCLRASEGTTNRVRLKEERFLALEMPMPPLPEQRRIVARIDELAAHIHEAITLRKQTEGEANGLLGSARGVMFRSCSSREVPLETVCAEVIDNLHSNPRIADSGIPCVRSPDVGYGTLDLANAQRTDEDEYRRRTVRGEPATGDLVLVREGGGAGKCALVSPGQKFSLGQRVMMLRPNPKCILPQFLLHQMLSPHIQQEQIGKLCKGSASPHLNISALKKFPLYVPPLPEQIRIVAELSALEEEVDALKLQQAGTSSELEAILPSILNRAFSGSL